MDKREFLKTSGALVAGTVASRFASGQSHAQQPAPHENWAGNIHYSTDHVHTPASLDEVRDVVKKCSKLRALGSRHSFNRIADSNANQVSLEHLTSIDIDDKARTVTVGAGVRYGELAPVIDAKGYALPNLASLPHISVAGAIATATHGSGIHNGNLATPVRALEVVSANGDVLNLSRDKDGDQFAGAVVHLGAVGAITRVTLDLEPTFQVAQTVYQDLSFSELEHNFDGIFGAGYSVSLFTDWQKHRATQVWIKRRVTPGEQHTAPELFYNARRATRKLHPITEHPAESCTEQMGIPGPWYQRLPHFKMEFTPSSGRELQTEYFVPREHGYEAILAVEKLKDKITPHLFVTELRTIAADNLWMSTAYQRDLLAIHFTWKPEWDAVKQILPQIETQLKPFNPRPHWAKLFTIPPAQLQAQYTRLADFRSLANQHDPTGKFRNDFIQTNLYSS
ncbi:FAD-binding protein [Occallatibacter savannae]|uniref:FAD-binding protein n=1 Tax=Occallatibacter savannae TaxID=1002691 RepID=UPI000D690CBF|nr:FAD-binding protein [Occallatibacter savannae]